MNGIYLAISCFIEILGLVCLITGIHITLSNRDELLDQIVMYPENNIILQNNHAQMLITIGIFNILGNLLLNGILYYIITFDEKRELEKYSKLIDKLEDYSD